MSQAGSLNGGGGGGGGTPITTINGDTGSATGATILLYANNAALNSGSTVKFVNSGSTSTLNVTDVNNNTSIGKSAGSTLTTGANNTSLGHLAGSSLTLADSNNISIGANVTGTTGDSNVTRIGSGQTKAFVAGIAGVSVANTNTVTIDSSTGQLGSQVGSPNVVIKGPNVNLLVAGATTIFTPTSQFVITSITQYAVNVTGVIFTAAASFGWTPATYNDYASAVPFFLTTTGTYASLSAESGLGTNDHLVLPASTPFVINVTGPDSTATTNTQRVDIIGYYL